MVIKYHKFTGDVPIIFVDTFEEFFKNVPMVTDNTVSSVFDKVPNSNIFFKQAYYPKDDQVFLIFDESAMRMLFGGDRKEQAIDAILSLYASSKKYSEPKKQFEDALKRLVKYQRKRAFDTLSGVYTMIFKTDPKTTFEWEDELPLDDEKNIDKILFFTGKKKHDQTRI